MWLNIKKPIKHLFYLILFSHFDLLPREFIPSNSDNAGEWVQSLLSLLIVLDMISNSIQLHVTQRPYIME